MKELLLLALTSMIIQNVVLVQFLGICPFIGVSKKFETATGMGLAVVFVITISALVTWSLQNYVLVPLQLEYLQTVMFILVIASLVQLVELFMQKTAPKLHAALGIYLPLITTNCAVMGVSLVAAQKQYSFVETLVFSFFTAAGFLLAILLLAGVRERLETATIPKFLRGYPIMLITAGLIGMSFMAFSSLKF